MDNFYTFASGWGGSRRKKTEPTGSGHVEKNLSISKQTALIPAKYLA